MSQDVLSKTPTALSKRDRMVELVDGGAVRVLRWNWAREQAALKFIVGILGKLDLKKLGTGNPFETAGSLMDLLGENLPELVKLSVSAEDFARFDDLAPVDRMGLLVAVFELNDLGAYAKKALGLRSLFPSNGTAK